MSILPSASTLPLSFQATLHVDAATAINGAGALAGGAIGTAYVAIWDPSILTGIMDVSDIAANVAYVDCTTAGVLAVGYNVTNIDNGGNQYITATTQSCSGGNYQIAPNQTVLIVAGSQLITNRGSSANALHTFTVALDPALPPSTVNALNASIAPQEVPSITSAPEPEGVPTLSEWAMIMFGVMLAGGAALNIQRRQLIS